MSDEWLTSSTSDLRGRLRGGAGADEPAAGPHVEPPGPAVEIAPPRVTASAPVTPRPPADPGNAALGWTEVRDTRIGWWNDGPEHPGDTGPLGRVRRLLRNRHRES